MERLVDVISQYCQDSSADLLVAGSQNLCVDGEQLVTVCAAAAELCSRVHDMGWTRERAQARGAVDYM
jgi:hypothetical protein